MATDGQTTTATYTCAEGYLIQGTQQQALSVTCTGSGQWSLTETPDCGKLSCNTFQIYRSTCVLHFPRLLITVGQALTYFLNKILK